MKTNEQIREEKLEPEPDCGRHACALYGRRHDHCIMKAREKQEQARKAKRSRR